jgi:hypothetical protein
MSISQVARIIGVSHCAQLANIPKWQKRQPVCKRQFLVCMQQKAASTDGLSFSDLTRDLDHRSPELMVPLEDSQAPTHRAF